MKTHNRFKPTLLVRALGLVALLLAAAAPAQGQARPDAGSLTPQKPAAPEPVSPQPAAPMLTPAAPAAAPAAAPRSGPTFAVRSYRIEGNTLLPAALLQQAAAAFTGDKVSFEDLQRAAAAVADAYRKEGWVVRTLLPKQDITDATVRILVVESKLARIRTEGDEPLRAFGGAAGLVANANPPGQLLNTGRLERSLLILNDTPGIQATASLQEGAGAGQTDVLLKLAPTAPLQADLSLDNRGSRATGAARLLLGGSLNNALRLGDQLTGQVMLSQGSQMLRVGWNTLVHPSGLRLGASASYLGYKLVASEYKQLNGKGNSQTLSVDASYPLLRSRSGSLRLTASVDRKGFRNEAMGAVNSKYSTTSVTVGADGYRFDAGDGGGVTSGQVAVTVGRVNLNGSPNQAADAQTTATAGTYAKIRASGSRRWPVNTRLTASVSGSAQIANKNLDSSERFYVGGPDSVAGYPTSEGGGSNGAQINASLRLRLPKNFGVSGLLDTGVVQQYARTGFRGAPAKNNLAYHGVGVRLDWQSQSGWSADLTLGWRIGKNPNPAASGKDQDGTLRRTQVWLGVRKSF